MTLADVGVDKTLSARSQRLAALPGKRFEIVTQRLLSFPTKVAYETQNVSRTVARLRHLSTVLGLIP